LMNGVEMGIAFQKIEGAFPDDEGVDLGVGKVRAEFVNEWSSD
jgi:hypothetical protein